MKSGTTLTAVQAAFAACLLFVYTAAADDLEWREITFNAVDGDAGRLMIAVGNDGAIVHITEGGEAHRFQPPTDPDLFDVHVGSKDFAIIVGQGVVLLWNGESWRPLTDVILNVRYYSTWASPDELLVLYAGGIDPYTVCPWIPNAFHQPFCRQFKAPMLGACGDHETIHLVLSNGEIYRVNNALLGHDGSFDPLYRLDHDLELRAVWIPEGSCPSDGLAEVYAVDTTGDLLRFDGGSWRALDPASPRLAKLQALHLGVHGYPH